MNINYQCFNKFLNDTGASVKVLIFTNYTINISILFVP